MLTIGALRKALSQERLAAYATADDNDELDAVARYLWNGALATAMVPALHALEVTVRNNVYDASLRIVDHTALKFSSVSCWLDADPTLLLKNEEQSVKDALAVLRRGKKPLTPGRLISKLSFGFWVGLCGSPYEQGRKDGPGLWPKMIGLAFPFLPKEHRSRSAIRKRLDEHRELRNRVFHHEPIWDRNLDRSHARIVDTIKWMNQGVAEALEHVSIIEEVIAEGPAGYRKVAEDMVTA